MCLDNHPHMQCADGENRNESREKDRKGRNVEELRRRLTMDKWYQRIVHGVGESPEYEVWGSFRSDVTKVYLSLDPGLFSV
ncbi:hypothetical protein BPAE_0003g00470 [Botrytis paeoniae]|uniref:Uncharacterized protein n=1 Tax=Botrytis paeoniae TaxID=278948 RepID=A0A4Z1G957_9HELO|nr:hypothetical protein BPAE_0003g00470 [Botrytis paeoniae]